MTHKVTICRDGAPVRHKLHIVCGCGKPRRLLTPLFLLSVKSHAAIRLFACKRAHDGSLLLPTFYGENALTTAHSCYQLFTGKRAHDGSLLLPTFYGKRRRVKIKAVFSLDTFFCCGYAEFRMGVGEFLICLQSCARNDIMIYYRLLRRFLKSVH